jgi:hypothetical protein
LLLRQLADALQKAVEDGRSLPRSVYLGVPSPDWELSSAGVTAAARAVDTAQVSSEPLPGARVGACAERSVGARAERSVGARAERSVGARAERSVGARAERSVGACDLQVTPAGLSASLRQGADAA